MSGGPAVAPRPFFFLRHGQTDWNAAGRIQGYTDVPLNETGVAQAAAAAERFAGEAIGVIVASPKLRALGTAAAVAERRGEPLHLDRRLIERGFGAFEGRPVAEFRAAMGAAPGAPLKGLSAPDGELWADTVARAVAAAGDWLGRAHAAPPLFVSHGGVFSALVDALLGDSMRSDNAEPYRFEPPTGAGGAWSVARL